MDTQAPPVHNRRPRAVADGLRPLAVSVARAGALLGICRAKTYELLRRGELRAVKIGTRTLIPVSELEAFLTRGLEAPAQARREPPA
jgi:excisionase family DNA binding protein